VVALLISFVFVVAFCQCDRCKQSSSITLSCVFIGSRWTQTYEQNGSVWAVTSSANALSKIDKRELRIPCDMTAIPAQASSRRERADASATNDTQLTIMPMEELNRGV
jgi:hypothetical protein